MSNILFWQENKFVFPKNIDRLQEKFDELLTVCKLMGYKIDRVGFDASSTMKFKIQYYFVRNESVHKISFTFFNGRDLTEVHFYYDEDEGCHINCEDTKLLELEIDNFINIL